MNPTLEQLAHEAGITVNAESAKFAELIVKECADFADEHNDASEGVTLGVGKAIKQHFGVEE